jgi:uridine kinase
VKPAYDNFVLPSSRYADIIVPGHDNAVAIELICTHVQRKLDERRARFRERMARSHISRELGLSPGVQTNTSNVICLKMTPQINGIFTILRDQTTTRGDFIFFANRLSILVIEKAMELLPFKDEALVTPVGAEMVGKTLATPITSLCGMSIIRAGGPLEHGLRRVIRDVAVGSMLIQTDIKTGDPMLMHLMMPACLQDRRRSADAWVFLLDAQIGTGASALMAIRILLDHGVREEQIIFVCFLIARNGGAHALRRAFPKVRIVCGAIDGQIREELVNDEGVERHVWSISPGMGHVGDRYYLK